MRKLLKIAAILALAALIVVAAAFIAYTVITRNAKLDESRLTNYGQSITVCDTDGREITSASPSAKRKSVKLEDLNDYTIEAFIASEDRTFFRHNGLNYKRMAKAVLTNITSRSFKEGASTISQQLIKNTHLSGDKTINRKLKEIKLTRELEKKFSKQQILEMYLNTIYFGHNCYGLESAAEFYFDATADNLTLEQSATLAGLLTSPNNLSPFKNPEKCVAKRNLVLKCMADCGYISGQTYRTAATTPLGAKESNSSDGIDCYLNAVLDELEELEIDHYKLADGCKIITYLDAGLQKFIQSNEYAEDAAVLITGNDGGVKAWFSTAGNIRRQPGSTIKPLLVYAPAIEEKLICPATKILDEKVNFGGYSPENHDKKYHGYVTAEESLAKSYNIPAVKTLNALTIDKANSYAKRMGIELDEDEKYLSLALGGMKYGLTLGELCEKYRAFPCGGEYTPTKFIKCITLNNGKKIYSADQKKVKVFSEGTCSLINDMLIQTVQNGTAKKLKELPFDVAAKTGTCGTAEGNTDAYCITYTSRDCIGVWLGSSHNTPSAVTGGGDCARLSRSILEKLYEENKPGRLDCSTGTISVDIDAEEYSLNNRIMLADDIAPKLAVKSIKVAQDAAPREKSHKFSSPTIKKPAISTKNNTVFIELCQTKYYSYIIKRRYNGLVVTVYDGEWTPEFTDEISEGSYTYSVTPYFQSGTKKYYGQQIILPSVSASAEQHSPQGDVPEIAKGEWFLE